MKVSALHHVNLNVSDVAAATDFYLDVLGLRARDDRPTDIGEGCWLDVGDQQIHLSLGEPPGDRGQHFALEVDDLEAAVAELAGKGIAVFGTERLAQRGQVFVRDPSGNRIELRRRAKVEG